jgi:hypothetical protein
MSGKSVLRVACCVTLADHVWHFRGATAHQTRNTEHGTRNTLPA